jgi:hypothetical protein
MTLSIPGYNLFVILLYIISICYYLPQPVEDSYSIILLVTYFTLEICPDLLWRDFNM